MCCGNDRNTSFTLTAAYTEDPPVPEGFDCPIGVFEVGPPAKVPQDGSKAKIKVLHAPPCNTGELCAPQLCTAAYSTRDINGMQLAICGAEICCWGPTLLMAVHGKLP